MKLFVCAVASVVLSSLSARGELLGYWDFNNSLLRSDGLQGTLSVEFNGFGIGYEDYGSGTSVNLLDGFPAGQSRRFNSLATIAETTRLTVLDLDFTGYTSPVISIAARNDGAFQAGDEFYLEYNIGGGWVRAETFTDPGSTYGVFSYAFNSGILDNIASVGLRYTHFTGVSALNEFEVDNLQINAVPEPSSVALIGFSTLILGVAFLRRKTAR